MRDQRPLTGRGMLRDVSAGEPPELVRVAGLAVGYGSGPVLRDVSFAVRGGERVGVLGPNGGGKTTLFRALLGELAPAAGTVWVSGRCGVVAQTDRSRLDYPVSALDVVLMGLVAARPWWRRPGAAERRAARGSLAAVGLEERAEETFGRLSGGQRQRVLVARALVQEPAVIVLDEPFVGLDATSAAQLDGLLARLAREGRALLIATHDVDLARGWERVLCLAGRQVVFGPPSTMLTADVVANTYGGALLALSTAHPGRG